MALAGQHGGHADSAGGGSGLGQAELGGSFDAYLHRPRVQLASATCSYGTCDGPDASSNTAVASCPGGTWTLVVRPCGATSDSGADVQRDAGDEDD